MRYGTHVRLSDGRTGFVCGSGLDGLTIHLDEGRIAYANPADVTVISAPTPTDPPPLQRTVQQPIRTSHNEPPAQVVENPKRLPVLVAGKWSPPQ
jgi:hypothetical protein